MAMEIKTLDVKNSKEAETIEFWAQFGWVLKSSQRIYNKDSHLEQRGDSTYSVTETVDFTKLVFERDKNGPHYDEIVSLEAEYFACMNALNKAEKEEKNVQARWTSKEGSLDFRTDADKKKHSRNKKLCLIPIIAGGVIAGLGATLAENLSLPEEIAMIPVGVGLPILLGGLALLIMSVSKGRQGKYQALQTAKGNPQSECGKIYQEEYDKFCRESSAVLQEKTYNENRIGEILDTLDTLI